MNPTCGFRQSLVTNNLENHGALAGRTLGSFATSCQNTPFWVLHRAAGDARRVSNKRWAACSVGLCAGSSVRLSQLLAFSTPQLANYCANLPTCALADSFYWVCLDTEDCSGCFLWFARALLGYCRPAQSWCKLPFFALSPTEVLLFLLMYVFGIGMATLAENEAAHTHTFNWAKCFSQ